MNQKNLLSRSLVVAAAALMFSATSAQAIGVGVNANASIGSTATNVVTETALAGKVKAKLATDARVKGSDISVTTENGVVVLTGTAPSNDAKAAAAEIAQSADVSAKIENRIQAPGVLSTVTNAVTTTADTSGEVINDSWITTKVKSKLVGDVATPGSAIKVTTKDNVVSLRGVVASQAEKDAAIKLATETKGVTKVNASKLKVSTKVKAKADANVTTN